jgi:hypothetical protein
MKYEKEESETKLFNLKQLDFKANAFPPDKLVYRNNCKDLRKIQVDQFRLEES